MAFVSFRSNPGHSRRARGREGATRETAWERRRCARLGTMRAGLIERRWAQVHGAGGGGGGRPRLPRAQGEGRPTGALHPCPSGSLATNLSAVQLLKHGVEMHACACARPLAFAAWIWSWRPGGHDCAPVLVQETKARWPSRWRSSRRRCAGWSRSSRRPAASSVRGRSPPRSAARRSVPRRTSHGCNGRLHLSSLSNALSPRSTAPLAVASASSQVR